MSVLIFLIVLSILILTHEIGHFVIAKLSGIDVLEFGWGIPPRIFGKKIGGTVYSINAFPFGGFVRLYGEEEEKRGNIDFSQRAFFKKPKKIRALVIVAGVLMNFVLAFFAFSIVYTLSGVPKETDKVRVVDLSVGAPAYEAGILVDDIVKTVDKSPVKTTGQFIDLIDQSRGEKVTLEVERVGETELKKIVLTPRESPPESEGPLGVAITNTEIVFPPLWQRPFLGFYFGLKESLFWGKTIILSLVQTFSTLIQGQVPKGIAGPVGIYGITSEVAKLGILPLVNFLGVLSINLAIINILPLPPLDGGRLLFIILEKFFGRSVLPRIERITNTAGFIFLMGLLLAITLTEVGKISKLGSFSEFTKGLLSQ